MSRHGASPDYSWLRGKTTTECRSRDEPGGAKAQRRTVAMTFMMLSRALELFSRHLLQILRLQAASKAQAYCLRSGGLVT
jgi:hypothetical protein